jgi:hypothetical protein
MIEFEEDYLIQNYIDEAYDRTRDDRDLKAWEELDANN